MQLKIAKIHAPVYSLGSGKRLAIWTQGCKQRCRACISPEFQSMEEGYIYPKESLVSKARFLIRNLNLTGISISGGEPMLQWIGLRDVVLTLKQEFGDLDVLVYTGYVYNKKQGKLISPSSEEIQFQTDWLDVLIDGEFRDWEIEERFLRGSKNQRILFLSKLGVERFYPYYKENKGKRLMQIFNDEDGVFLTGVPDSTLRYVNGW